jgi:hypothetical protein
MHDSDARFGTRVHSNLLLIFFVAGHYRAEHEAQADAAYRIEAAGANRASQFASIAVWGTIRPRSKSRAAVSALQKSRSYQNRIHKNPSEEFE